MNREKIITPEVNETSNLSPEDALYEQLESLYVQRETIERNIKQAIDKLPDSEGTRLLKLLNQHN